MVVLNEWFQQNGSRSSIFVVFSLSSDEFEELSEGLMEPLFKHFGADIVKYGVSITA